MNKHLWKGEQVLEIIKGHGPSNWRASGVSIDTRTLRKGDIFFALAGPNYDGHQFISSAIKKGASAIISNAPSLEFKEKVVIVNDVLKSLVSLGKFSRKRNNGKIIAITGSSGKTTVKEMSALLLNKFGKIHYSEASYNNKIGVSLSLARMPADADFSIFELGMNQSGEISYLSNLVKPHVALINNVGSAHIGYLKSKKEIEKAKIEILDGLALNGKLILNDNISLASNHKKNLIKKNIEILKFGYKKNSDLILKKYKYSPNLSMVDAIVNSLKISYSLKSPGEHMAINSIAVLGIFFMGSLRSKLYRSEMVINCLNIQLFLCDPIGTIPPECIEILSSGITLCKLILLTVPKPLHLRHIPLGELNEKELGSGLE